MAADASREGELLEEALETLNILTLVWVHLTVNSLQVEVRDQIWSTVAWPRYNESIKVVFLDQSVHVNVSK